MLRKLSIRTQLIAMILLTSTLAMVVAGVTLFETEISRSREALNEELTSLARLVGDRSSAALIFLDNKTATENLNSLSGLEQIDSACLFNEHGEQFAEFRRADAKTVSCVMFLPVDQTIARFEAGTVHVQVPIYAHADLIGAVQINSTASPLIRRLAAQTLSLAIALGAALAVAVLFALRLQRLITQPLAQVRDVANAIIKSKNYALRAPDLGQHELGQLSSAFNSMLQTIETQNIVLAESEAYSKQLFYDSPIPQLVSDPVSLAYIDCNLAAAKLHGFSCREELIGKTTLDVAAPFQYDGRPSSEVLSQRYCSVKEELINVYEWHYRKLDGSLWDGLVTYMIFTLNGRNFLHISVEDITYRKQAEIRLQKMNEELEDRVNNRTTELASANNTLKGTLYELQRTQTELVQREKMASLGVLIAGVAHEMNTPLGICLTVSSSLEDELSAFDALVAEGKVTKNRLHAFDEKMITGLQLLRRNLDRAIEQVTRFKQVSVDQTSDQRRRFNLEVTIADIVAIVQPQFKRTPHKIFVEIQAGFTMDSYPGALGQVVTNLLLNSLIHGFSNEMSGVITITAQMDNEDQVHLVVTDNGRGIPAKNLSHIFDPFFTTRMGQGGSGLGLNIVFNIVTANLGGSIRVSSEEGIRTTFTIIMPRIAPTSKALIDELN